MAFMVYSLQFAAYISIEMFVALDKNEDNKRQLTIRRVKNGKRT
jgi:hypothetical protein